MFRSRLLVTRCMPLFGFSISTSLCVGDELKTKKAIARDIEAFDLTHKLAKGFQIVQDKEPSKKDQNSLNTFEVSFLDFEKDQLYQNGDIYKLATIEINVALEEVEKAWMNQKLRKDWDKSFVSDSYVINDVKDGLQINYFKTNSSTLVPARDYAFTTHKTLGTVVGSNRFGARVLTNLDAGSLVEPSWNCVRGFQNSLMVLEPMNPTKTKVTFFVHHNPQGWSWISPQLSSLWVGDSPLQSLINLKTSLEAELNEDYDTSISIEEAARRKLKKKLEKEAAMKKSDEENFLDDPSMTVKDLEILIRVLERRLENLKESEKKDHLNLSELKSRALSDLSQARAKLHRKKSMSSVGSSQGTGGAGTGGGGGEGIGGGGATIKK